jgi:hypothetical protein
MIVWKKPVGAICEQQQKQSSGPDWSEWLLVGAVLDAHCGTRVPLLVSS